MLRGNIVIQVRRAGGHTGVAAGPVNDLSPLETERWNRENLIRHPILGGRGGRGGGGEGAYLQQGGTDRQTDGGMRTDCRGGKVIAGKRGNFCPRKFSRHSESERRSVSAELQQTSVAATPPPSPHASLSGRVGGEGAEGGRCQAGDGADLSLGFAPSPPPSRRASAAVS